MGSICLCNGNDWPQNSAAVWVCVQSWNGRVRPGFKIGLVVILSLSSSASCSRLAFALRFWNQIFTCVSVRLRELENSARSAIDRYCFWRNLRSRAKSWVVVKGVRGLRFVLCFLREHVAGLDAPIKWVHLLAHKLFVPFKKSLNLTLNGFCTVG